MNLANYVSNGEDCFILEGIIDAHAEDALKEIPKKVKHPVARFDFSLAGRINSMGIALILRCFKEISDKAEIRIEGLNQTHSMLFKMTGVFLLAAPVKAPVGRKEGTA
ncbi:STAS domain-containing protein [Geomonas oryzae]|uniref:hypothetical protein n=1 Tax=Geomonas oryzae TaxID=2364273 RepID=UPI00100ACFD8|nr:hypothetical protein [Geomonas oryzae]